MGKWRLLGSGSRVAAAVTVGLVGAGLTEQASAQDAADSNEIVVTGSYIRGTPEDAALPVDVISAQELQQQGNPTALELIKNLTVGGPVLGDTNQFQPSAQGQTGAGTINLRGLGGNRTLFLMNGRRTTVSPGGGSPDTNLVPVAAIGRIELLKDGAAATYGSDAIAGVVNFITRRDLDGLDISTSFKAVDNTDGDYDLAVNWGWIGDRSNVLISFGHQHRSEMNTTDRDWSYQPYTVNASGWSQLANPGAYSPVASTVAAAANTAYVGVQPSSTISLGSVLDANCTQNGGALSAQFALGNVPRCAWTYIPFDNLVEETNQYQTYAEINTELADNLDLHIEGLFSNTNLPHWDTSPGYPPTIGPAGPNTSFFIPNANPGVATFLAQTGAAAAGAGWNTGLFGWRPIANGGAPLQNNGARTSSYNYDLYRVSASLTGILSNDVRWNTAVTYSNEEYQVGGTGDLSITRLQAALQGFGGPNCDSSPAPGIQPGAPAGGTAGAFTCLWFNPFSNGYQGNTALGLTNPGYVAPPANTNTLTLFDWMQPQGLTTQTQDLFVFDAVVDGQTSFELGGGPISWAVGGQYRRSVYHLDVGNPLGDSEANPCIVEGDVSCPILFRTGTFIFLGNNRDRVLEQSVYAVFGETTLPVTDNFDVNFAIRYEDYGGATGATTNPKLNLHWRLADFLSLRASAGTTFRGPTAGNVQSGIVATALQSLGAAVSSGFRSVDIFGNPNVEPEKGTNYSVGVIFETDNFRLITDYWNIKLEDPIQLVSASSIVTAVTGNSSGVLSVAQCASPFAALITFTGGPCVGGTTTGASIARVRSDTINGPEYQLSGIDMTASYTIDDVLGGTLTLGGEGSYLLEYELGATRFLGSQLEAARDAVGLLNYNIVPGSMPEYRVNLFANLNRGPMNLRYEFRYTDGLTDNRTDAAGTTGQAVQIGPTPASCTATYGASGASPNCVYSNFGTNIDPFFTHNLFLVYELPQDFSLSFSVQNIADRDPSATRTELSYDPGVGNAYGRTFEIGIRKRF